MARLQILTIADEVRAALAAKMPVVALESTIITHGMPYPQNLEMARNVERLIREEGAVPATIAVIKGRLFVGLEDGQLEALGRHENPLKLSRADLAHAVATGATGGTTVAATMIAANLAGIRVFATGGIGGVHQGAETSFDISADLDELARTPVIVVSAGPKAILDIGKTLEVLEARGVPVIGYGTDTVPAFWSPSSEFPAPIRYDEAAGIARFQATRDALGITGGMLVTNPVPESDGIAPDIMANHIETALSDADREGISGKDVTPYLLNRIFDLTGGESLKANIALVENNARLAASIATELARP